MYFMNFTHFKKSLWYSFKAWWTLLFHALDNFSVTIKLLVNTHLSRLTPVAISYKKELLERNQWLHSPNLQKQNKNFKRQKTLSKSYGNLFGGTMFLFFNQITGKYVYNYTFWRMVPSIELLTSPLHI